jgi:hypothetical protein
METKNIEHLVNFKSTTIKREVVATFYEFAKLAGAKEIELYGPNLANPEVRVMIRMVREDGLVSTIVCSRGVSDLIRTKQVTLDQLKSFPVVEGISKNGEVFPQIEKPDGQMDKSQLLGFAFTNEVQEFVPQAKTYEFNPEDLVAW